LRALARHSETSVGQLLRPLVPWGWRTLVVLVLAAGVALLWSPPHVLGLVGVSIATVLVYAGVVGPAAFHGPLESYVRPRWNALFARLSMSKPTGAP
ncbi:MAG TPA: hypothetical protein VF794_09045, partial [Archangium sp.]|uniref:hypothetical protein n=1 Tax=Archangium sp. TaxID=1872627 RepID=UPI002EDAAAE0